LLILEGLPAVILGALTYFLLPNRPAEASFLSKRERDSISVQLKNEAEYKQQGHQISAAAALIHGRVWHLAFAALVHGAAFYAVFFWMPQILKTLSGNYSNTVVGFLVMVPYVVGMLTMILISRRSDRKLERRWHVAIPALIAAIACVILGVGHSLFISVVLLSIAVGCICGYLGPFWALPSEFLMGASAASGIALITTFVNLGGFVGPYVFGFVRQRTDGFYGSMVAAGGVLFVFASLVLVLRVSASQLERFPRPSADDSA